jgi:hypothetical protein
MTDCAFFPDDPACMDQSMTGMKMEGDSHFTETEMMEANIAFFFAAALAATWSGLDLFRFHAADDYYTDGDQLDTNWWKILD